MASTTSWKTSGRRMASPTKSGLLAWRFVGQSAAPPRTFEWVILKRGAEACQYSQVISGSSLEGGCLISAPWFQLIPIHIYPLTRGLKTTWESPAERPESQLPERAWMVCCRSLFSPIHPTENHPQIVVPCPDTPWAL